MLYPIFLRSGKRILEMEWLTKFKLRERSSKTKSQCSLTRLLLSTLSRLMDGWMGNNHIVDHCLSLLPV